MSVESLDEGALETFNFAPIQITEEGLLVTYNPLSELAKEKAEFLRRHGPGMWPGKGPVFIHPTEKTIKDNEELFMEFAAVGPMHQAIVGGDGTHAKSLIAKHNSGISGIPTLVAAGKANDLARTLHSPKEVSDPIEALTNGYVTRIHPLDIRIENPDAKEGKLKAINYAGIGLTGTMAEVFDSDDYRKSPKPENRVFKRLIDALIVDSHRSIAESFKVIDETGETREVYEELVLKGARMATFRFGSIARLEQPRASRIELEHRQRKDLILALGKLAMGRLALGTHTLGVGEELILKVERGASSKPVIFQTDGEHQPLQDGAILHFGISPEAIMVAGTRRKLLRAT